jgi:hypothetical protein
MLTALQARTAQLAQYGGVYACASEVTTPAVLSELGQLEGRLGSEGSGQIGAGRRWALRAAFEAGFGAFLYCDFDRWLHWAGRFPEELARVAARLSARRPLPWYACLGRTARAYATHPYVQRLAERATNHAFGLAIGRRIDATAGACWLSRVGAALVLEHSREETNATDLEWPAIVFRADPRRLAYMATEGLEFETAEFFPREVEAAGGDVAWMRARYERPDVWLARLRLAIDSVRAAHDVLIAAPPRLGTDLTT